jgi:hypothetical protein
LGDRIYIIERRAAWGSIPILVWVNKIKKHTIQMNIHTLTIIGAHVEGMAKQQPHNNKGAGST